MIGAKINTSQNHAWKKLQFKDTLAGDLISTAFWDSLGTLEMNITIKHKLHSGPHIIDPHLVNQEPY